MNIKNGAAMKREKIPFVTKILQFQRITKNYKKKKYSTLRSSSTANFSFTGSVGSDNLNLYLSNVASLVGVAV